MGRAGVERTTETWRVYRTLVGPVGARSLKAAAAQLIRTGEGDWRRHIMIRYKKKQCLCLRFRSDGLIGHSDLTQKDRTKLYATLAFLRLLGKRGAR